MKECLNSSQLQIFNFSAAHQLLAGPVSTALIVASSSTSVRGLSDRKFSHFSMNSKTSQVSRFCPKVGNSRLIGGLGVDEEGIAEKKNKLDPKSYG